MSEEPKPVRCGCGGEVEIIKHTFHKLSPSYGIECTNCHTESWQFYNTEAEAIQAWNLAMGATDTNVGDKERTAKVDAGHKSVITGKLMDGHCMQCGRYVMDEDDYCPGCGARLEWNE